MGSNWAVTKKSLRSKILHFDGSGCGNRKEGNNFIGHICFDREAKEKEGSKLKQKFYTRTTCA